MIVIVIDCNHFVYKCHGIPNKLIVSHLIKIDKDDTLWLNGLMDF